MKILWLCNIPLPKVSEAMGVASFVTGGWLDLLSTQISSEDGYKLAISFPLRNIKKAIEGAVDKIDYYAIPTTKYNRTHYDKRIEKYYSKLLDKYKPDIIHIWGTEFPRSLAMVIACKKKNFLNRVIVDLQGLCSKIEKHCTASLPINIIHRRTLVDLIKIDSIYLQKKAYIKRGKFEVQLLMEIKKVIGRTDWDKACISEINPSVDYLSCNRILRESFYSSNWDINMCQKHSILLSQGSKPLKGLHFMLEAMPSVLRYYPDTHLYVAGEIITSKRVGIHSILGLSSYGKYIKKIIKENNLDKKVTFLGPLQEKEMHTRFLKSHVFVSASSIENSPNSVGEAMILGVPTIASYVGGVSSMLEHNKEGYLYQHDAPYMLACYIKNIFSDDDLALEVSSNARNRAKVTHDKDKNFERIMEVYKSIMT